MKMRLQNVSDVAEYKRIRDFVLSSDVFLVCCEARPTTARFSPSRSSRYNFRLVTSPQLIIQSRSRIKIPMLTETMGQRRFRDPNMTWIKIDTLKNLPALVAFLDNCSFPFFLTSI